jgi:hypothetical protein
MSCGITDPLSCAGRLAAGEVIGAWDLVCASFASAADALLKVFARAFTAIPPVDLASPAVKNVYGICLGIAAAVAAVLLLVQVIRTAISRDGSPLAEGLTGIGKAAIAFLLTLVITSAAVTAADSLTTYIIDRSFGSAAGLTAHLTTLLSFAGRTGHLKAEVAGGASLLLLLALLGIALVLVLWFELLLRNAAIAVLVATSPIAAAGLASSASRSWWPRTAWATGQLIAVKPIIALIFATGLSLAGGRSRGIETLLAGMLILLLAAVAWPVIARFLTFSTVGAPASAGLGIALGFVAGRLAGGGGGGNLPGGGLPGQLGAGEGEGAAGAAAGEAAGGAGAAAGVAAGGAAAGVLALAAAGVQVAHRVSTALAGQMGDVAGNAGLAPPGSGYHGYREGGRWQRASRPASELNGPCSSPPDDDWASSPWPEPDEDPWQGPGWPQENRPAGRHRPGPSPGSLATPAVPDDDPAGEDGTAGS